MGLLEEQYKKKISHFVVLGKRVMSWDDSLEKAREERVFREIDYHDYLFQTENIRDIKNRHRGCFDSCQFS